MDIFIYSALFCKESISGDFSPGSVTELFRNEMLFDALSMYKFLTCRFCDIQNDITMLFLTSPKKFL